MALGAGVDGTTNSQEDCNPMHGQNPLSTEGGNLESEMKDGSDTQSKGMIVLFGCRTAEE